jgi:hypothetical protein
LSHENATVRDWTDILARIRFGVVRIDKRNTVAGSAIKAVAGRLADYADSDGSRIRPGLARVALDLELSYETVKRAVGVLTRIGLLRLVHAAARRGDANVYRLAIPGDLIERVEVWTPAKQALEISRINETKKGRRRATDDAPDPGPQGSQRPAESGQERPPAERSAPSVPVDNSHPQSAQRPAEEYGDDGAAGRSAPAQAEPQGAQLLSRRALSAPPPTTDLTTTETDHPDHDVRTAVTGPRATGPGNQDPISRGVIPAPRTAPAAASFVATLTADDPPPDREPCRPGLGWCVPCYATGHIVLASDPTASLCVTHTRERIPA